jgi:hypothetical protein
VRWGSTSRSTRLTCGRVSWGIFFPPVLLERQQEGRGEEAQGAMVVPARPAAHLILIQPRFAFGRLDLGLDDPAGGGHLGQRQQGRVRGRIGEVVARLAPVQIAPHDQPAGAPGQAIPAFPDAQGSAHLPSESLP